MVLYLAGSRKKKIKKLVLLSLDIIRSYGLRYYIDVAISELKSQKFDILKPDQVPNFELTKIDNSLQYELLLDKEKNLDESKIKDEIQQFDKKPHFCMVLFGHAEENTETINSLRDQIYCNWNLVIYGAKSDSNYSDERITHVGSLHDCLVDIKDNDLVGFVESGDILRRDYLYLIAKHANDTNADLIYADHDRIDSKNKQANPSFKPDWTPYLLLSTNFIQRFFVRKRILSKTEGIRMEFEDQALYDLLLRCTEKTEKIHHVPKVLYSIAHTKHNDKLAIRALSEHLHRKGVKGEVTRGIHPGTYQVSFFISEQPKVSIIIPTKDKKKLLRRCLKSIETKTDYKNWEIIIVDNNSQKTDMKEYLGGLQYVVLNYENPFNFSKMNNLAASYAKGEYLLFLNDDTAALERQWLNELMGVCSQADVGAVGPKLVHSDDTIQHAGMVFLKTGAGFHPFQRYHHKDEGYMGFINLMRDYSAVTGACMLVKRQVFEIVGGFDDSFDLYYGDSDLCMKIRDAGYRVVYTPFTRLLHEGSTSIREHSDAFFTVENHYHFIKKWPALKSGDPLYHPIFGWNYNIDIQDS